MAVKTEKSFRSFVKGLITEASELTFPEGSLVDGENFVLKRDGSLERRLGIDYENLYELTSTGLTTEQIAGTKAQFYRWNSPTGDSSLSIGIIRIYNKMWFVNLLTANPSHSDNFLNSGNPITIDGLTTSELQFANINNDLILASKELEAPLVLTYDVNTDVISTGFINLKIRDLLGVHDGLDVSERPGYKNTSGIKQWVSKASFNVGDEIYYGSNIYLITSQRNRTTSVYQSTQIVNVPATPQMGTSAPTHTSGVVQNGDYFLTYVRAISSSQGSQQHRYNLRNQGWSKYIKVVGDGDAIDRTAEELGKFPANSDVWTLGKNSNPSSGDYEKYDPNILEKNSTSKYQVARGSHIIDAFDRGNSRQEASEDASITQLVSDKERGKITTITSYAQRVFYSGVESDILGPDVRSPNYNNFIFFSRIVRNTEDLEKCYQEADPTDPGINDLVASDGGTIQIPDITRIIKIVGGQSSLLVFAENGVWEVYGDTGGFFANNFQVAKVSTNGVLGPNSIVQVGNSFVYFSASGIYSLTTESASGRFAAENISLKTIQELYLEIPYLGKKYAKGYYDEKENRVRFLYNDSDSYSETSYVNKYNKELIYDLTLQAFYKNSFSELSSDPAYIADYVDIPLYTSSSNETNVLAGTDKVIDNTSSNKSVVVNVDIEADRDTLFSFLTLKGTSWTLSKFKNRTFKDWVTADATGVDYLSYLITGYEYYNDLMKRKQVSYIQFYFIRTEDGFSSSGDNLILDNQSSCKVQAQWNWADSTNSGKWGNEFQAYKLLRNYIPSGASDTFDYGDKVIVTKNKLRGSGKTLSLYIKSEEGKDMKLLGWGTPVTMSNNV